MAYLSKKEIEANKIQSKLLDCINNELAPALRDFLFNTVDEFPDKLDPQFNLKYLKRMCVLNSNFLTNGYDNNRNSIDIIDRSLEGRNAACHWDTYLIIINWKDYIVNWAELAKITGYDQTSKRIKDYEKVISASIMPTAKTSAKKPATAPAPNEPATKKKCVREEISWP